MPDERKDSIRQGVAAPPESPSGEAAAGERRERAASGPAVGGGTGGTPDAERPGDEARAEAAREAPEEDPAAMYRDIPEDRIGG